jgi:hypothetical protein
MSTFTALVLVLGALVGVNLIARWLRARRRDQAAVLPPGEPLLRRADGVSARLFTDAQVAGGPKPGGYSQGAASLLLTERRLVLATEWGRAIEINAEQPGELRWTGPTRVVVEGSHPSGRARVRAELILKDDRAWLDAAAAVPGATVQRPD